MKRILLLVTVMTSLVLVGCGDEAAVPPGNLRIDWRVGSSSDCALYGIETIAVYLVGGGQSASELYTFSCEAQSGVITDLEPGTYDLNLRGRDRDGIDRFGGSESNVSVRSAGTTNVPTVQLSALPATLVVSWYFENGRMCAYNDIETVDITLFEDEYEILSTEAACIDGLVELPDIQADTYILDLLARDAEGRGLFGGQEEITVERGDREDVEIRLSEMGQRASVSD